jgi:invasion protein IalB
VIANNPTGSRHAVDRRSWLVAACLALATLAPAPGAQAAEEDQKAGGQKSTDQKFKDWLMRCEKPEGQDSEICFIAQGVTVKENNKRLLSVIVLPVPKDGKFGAIFAMPLGISLPPGVALQIDEGEKVQVPVERCEPGGCRAELVLDDKLLGAMKNGKKAGVTFYDPARRAIPVPISLDGFKAGFDAMQKANQKLAGGKSGKAEKPKAEPKLSTD